MRLFDTVSLHLFVTVCDEKSIAIAAEKAAIVPSAVSKRMSALEELVGVQLLERGRRGVEPTPAGEALLTYARELLVSMERMRSELSTFSNGIQGHVRVFASMSAVAAFLQRDIGSFLKKYEKVRVTVIERVTADIVRGVEEGRADVGVCWGEADLRRLARQPYRADDLVAVMAPNHPLAGRPSVAFADLLDFEVVDILVGSIVQSRMQKEAAAIGKQLKYRIQVTTFEAACRAVADSLGVAVIPEQLVSRDLDLVRVPIDDAWVHRRLVVISRDEIHTELPARLLIDHLVGAARE